MQGAEDHVHTLRETVKYYWRRKRSSVAIFADFKKAYDRVHPEAMTRILRYRGLPDSLVQLLSAWSAGRRTKMTVNGITSEPWHMAMGVCQGDPLSPILFNLFIDSLARYVESKPHGGFPESEINPRYLSKDGKTLMTLTPSPLRFRILMYADDVVFLFPDSRTTGMMYDCRMVANVLQEWCEAWGMELGLGAGKTQAMYFPVPGSKPTENLTSIPIFGTGLAPTGKHIEWTTEYRYLGYPVLPTLSTTGLLDAMIERMDQNWKRFFVANPLSNRISPVMALQIYRACVLGSTNYLLALIEPTQVNLSTLDRHTKRVVEQCMQMRGSAKDAVWGDCRLPRAEGILARERARLTLHCEGLPLPGSIICSLAYKLKLEAVEVGTAALRTRTRQPYYSWFWRMTDLFNEVQAKHQIPRPTTQRWLDDVTRTNQPYFMLATLAGVYGRAVGHATWQSAARAHFLASTSHQVVVPTSNTPCPDTGKLQNAAWFNMGYSHSTADLGSHRGATPLSTRGPMCSGSLLAMCDRQTPYVHRMALGNLRLGKAGLYQVPLAPPGRTINDLRTGVMRDHGLAPVAPDDGEPAAEAAQVPWTHLMNSSSACYRCGMPRESPYHVCVECTHAPVQHVRQEVIEGLPSLITDLMRRALQAHYCAPFQPLPPVLEARAVAIGEQASGMDWTSTEGNWVLYRLLAVAPWPAKAAAQGHSLALALGQVFDEVIAKNHRIRRVANKWVPWAGGTVMRLHDAWSGRLRPHLPSVDVDLDVAHDDEAEWEFLDDAEVNRQEEVEAAFVAVEPLGFL